MTACKTSRLKWEWTNLTAVGQIKDFGCYTSNSFFFFFTYDKLYSKRPFCHQHINNQKEISILQHLAHPDRNKEKKGLGRLRVCLPTWLGGRYPSVRVRKHTCCGVFACVHAVSLMELGDCRLFSPHRPTASWASTQAFSRFQFKERRWGGIPLFLLSSTRC